MSAYSFTFSNSTRYVGLLLLAVCGFFVLSGCGGGEENTSVPAVEQSDWRQEKKGKRQTKKSDADEEKGQEKAKKSEKKKESKQAVSKSKKKRKANSKAGRIENPANKFVLSELPAHTMNLVSSEEGVQNANTFAVLSQPIETDSRVHRVVSVPKDSTANKKGKGLELPEGFEEIQGTGYSESGWPLRIKCLADDSEMVFQQGGVSVLGTDQGPENCVPAIKVTIAPFYIDVTEVTVRQYELFRARRYSESRVKLPEPLNVNGPPEHPVLGCNFSQANTYCKWTGKRMPTEAEWEYAARGNAGAQYPWREGRPLWQTEPQLEQVAAVMSEKFDRTPEGVFDMAGNALEWCADWYYPSTFQRATDALDQPIRAFTGPKRKPTDGERVVKGGGNNWSAWTRQGIPQTEKSETVSFRCVLPLSDE